MERISSITLEYGYIEISFIIRERKVSEFRIVKRKRMVPKVVKHGKKQVTEEVEEEYDACMKVETVTQTVQIRDVQENGKVEITEQDYVQEYVIGKERKYKYVKVEKKLDDGTRGEVDEIEVEEEEEEEESEEEKSPTTRKKKYDSQYESVEEGGEAGESVEQESRAQEEFSVIKEEVEDEKEFITPAAEEEYLAEEIKPEEKERKAMYELIEEVQEEPLVEEEVVVEEEEEEEEEMLPRETSWEREQKQQKVFFFKLAKMFFVEIERRKTLMRDFKRTCRSKGIQIKSNKTQQEFIVEEADEVEALMQHLEKVYAEYKGEEEEVYKKDHEGSRIEVELPREEIKDEELKLIRQAAKGLLKGMPKLIDHTLKYEELLSKKDQPVKDIVGENIDSIKHTLLVGIEQRNILAEKKKVEPWAWQRGYEVDRKIYTKTIEKLVCKKREAEFMVKNEKNFIKKKQELEKDFDERERNYWKMRKHADKILAAERKLKLADDESRFPAIIFNEKRKNAMEAEMGKVVSKLCRRFPAIKNAVTSNQLRPPKNKPMKANFRKMKIRTHSRTKNCIVPPPSLQEETSKCRIAEKQRLQ